jgi:hypothetical protein
MVIGVSCRLVANDSVADVDTLHERLLGEGVEHPVDTRERDRLTCAAQLVVDLACPEAAGL